MKVKASIVRIIEIPDVVIEGMDEAAKDQYILEYVEDEMLPFIDLNSVVELNWEKI